MYDKYRVFYSYRVSSYSIFSLLIPVTPRRAFLKPILLMSKWIFKKSNFCLFFVSFVSKVMWYSHLLQNFPQFIVIHTVKGFGIVNKAEIDVFLELSCFFNDPADVGNLICGSSAFSETSLNIWKFTVHILLKPGLENFEHYFTSV